MKGPEPVAGGDVLPQERELASLLDRIVRAPSPFYRAAVSAGESSKSRRCADVLARLPPTTRAELIRDQLAALPFGTRRFADAPWPVRLGTTGTGSELLLLAWTAGDLARERAAGVRVLERVGVQRGMRVANALAGALTTPGALLFGDAVEELGALDVPLGVMAGGEQARQAWGLIDRVEPAVIVLEPAAAQPLFAVAPERRRPWCCGIVWLDRGTRPAPAPPAVPAKLGFTGWQRSWLAIPEVTSFVAASCPAAESAAREDVRFHVDEAVIAEIVESTSAVPVSAGRRGSLLLTPLGVDAPLLRYASGLRVKRSDTPCPCGAGGVSFQFD
jgi:phenylacetate-coenzyme A ligase PaaK-like adenylate-forming protein